MKKLSYQTLAGQGYAGYLLKDAPERVLQFGEGNFLRAFAEDFIDRMNERAGFAGKVVLVQPRPQSPASSSLRDALNAQQGLYTLCLRGMENGRAVAHRRVLSCVSRCLNAAADYDAVMACAGNPDLRFILSNTTEAGIAYDPACRLEDRPAASFPGKLTQFLYRRYQLFGGQPGRGFWILPCELTDDNGGALEACVRRYAAQWGLGAGFAGWLERENTFCRTLVDRIVTGFPQKEAQALNAENGYEDRAMDAGELFGFWAIEAPQSLKEELPFEKAGLPVLVTGDYRPYQQRKVRILNGAHTAMALGAYLAGQDTVRGCMEDRVIRGFIDRAIYAEILPTLSLPRDELEPFAAAVEERFQNPFIDHALLSISLNSTSKWRARVLPSLLGYVEKCGELPPCLTASLAFYIAFYSGSQLTGQGLSAVRPGGGAYTVQDSRRVLAFFAAHGADGPAARAHAVCANAALWGMDLSAVPGLEAAVADGLRLIAESGARALMERAQASSSRETGAPL